MPINADHSGLTRPVEIGFFPDTEPVFLNRLMKAWLTKYLADGRGPKPPANPDLPYRASDAGNRCDRFQYYALMNTKCEMCDGTGMVDIGDREKLGDVFTSVDLCPDCEGNGVIGIKKTNETTVADYWRFAMGDAAHREAQDAAPIAFPGAQHEVKVDLRTIGIPGSAHADAMIPKNGKPHTVIEYKSVSGYQFKNHALGVKGPPEGPKYGAVIQGALSAAALDCEQLIVIDLALENLSPEVAARNETGEVGRFGAQWHWTRDEINEIVEYERDRIDRLLAFKESGILPIREIHDPSVPKGAVITDPTKGLWTLTTMSNSGQQVVLGHGSKWYCNYCPYRDRCLEDGAGGSTGPDKERF